MPVSLAIVAGKLADRLFQTLAYVRLYITWLLISIVNLRFFCVFQIFKLSLFYK